MAISKAETLRWAHFAGPGQWLHVARSGHRSVTALRPHTHDFAEVFWIETGRGVHQINGQSKKMLAGDVILIRPRDRHGFAARRTGGFTMVNVAFPAPVLRQLRQRLYPEGGFAWDGDKLPARHAVDATRLRRLTAWADELAAGARSRLELERFLLNLLHLLAAPAPAVSGPPLPEWLAEALARFNEPRRLALGLPELVRLTGRCPEHVNRIIRAHTGQTATQLVAQLRMKHAARQLAMTQRPITHIAGDCGLENLGHFYKLFKAHHGLTPRRYRLKQHAFAG